MVKEAQELNQYFTKHKFQSEAQNELLQLITKIMQEASDWNKEKIGQAIRPQEAPPVLPGAGNEQAAENSNKRKQEDGSFKCTLDKPDFDTIVGECKVADTRKKVEVAYNSRCKEVNTPIMEKIISHRHKKAQLLGYSSHQDFVVEECMAKTAANVRAFLSDFGWKLQPAVKSDLAALKALKAQHEGGGEIMEYDRAFYCKMLEATKCGVEHEALKEYFPLDTVTAGLLGIYEGLLGLKFERELSMEGAAAWHEDVKAYRTTDTASGKLVGFFYLDLHPREGKFGHCACFYLQNGCQVGGQRQLPIPANSNMDL